jgi:CDP-diacylglycerol--serine O-phosphatidyltransferase
LKDRHDLTPKPSKLRRRVRYVAILPSLITLGNGICGLAAMYECVQSPPNYLVAGWLILIGMIFDGLDGKVARATHTASAFGTQLDSLCDAITFGVAPSVVMISMMTTIYGPGHSIHPDLLRSLWAIGIIYASCAIIRLARFNVETSTDDSHQSFAGLPSPGAGGTVAAAVITYYFLKDSPEWQPLAEHGLIVLPIMAFFLGLLMVSRIKYAHVMNKLLRGKRPFTTLVEVALVIALIAILHEVAVFVVFFGYSLTGPVVALRQAMRPKRLTATEGPEAAHDPTSVH